MNKIALDFFGLPYARRLRDADANGRHPRGVATGAANGGPVGAVVGGAVGAVAGSARLCARRSPGQCRYHDRYGHVHYHMCH